MSVAFQFLVWGGIGGAPTGRGVLIPGSPAAFPASSEGITKCWQRYTPPPVALAGFDYGLEGRWFLIFEKPWGLGWY